MIREIKTALMEQESRADTETPMRSDEIATDDEAQGTPAVEDEDARGAPAVEDDASETPAVGEVDPFLPEFNLQDRPRRDEVDMDQIFGVLRNSRRRYALKYLSMERDVITMSDLAEQVAAWECNKEVDQLSSKERKRVYVSLYQSHLPKMADASAIEYDQDRGTIECGERFEQFSHFLRRDE